jgi:hypothetical protein
MPSNMCLKIYAYNYVLSNIRLQIYAFIRIDLIQLKPKQNVARKNVNLKKMKTNKKYRLKKNIDLKKYRPKKI